MASLLETVGGRKAVVLARKAWSQRCQRAHTRSDIMATVMSHHKGAAAGAGCVALITVMAGVSPSVVARHDTPPRQYSQEVASNGPAGPLNARAAQHPSTSGRPSERWN